MQDNLSVQSGLNAQLLPSVLVPFSNDVTLKGIALDKKMLLQFIMHLNLMLLTHKSLPHEFYSSLFTHKLKEESKLGGN